MLRNCAGHIRDWPIEKRKAALHKLLHRVRFLQNLFLAPWARARRPRRGGRARGSSPSSFARDRAEAHAARLTATVLGVQSRSEPSRGLTRSATIAGVKMTWRVTRAEPALRLRLKRISTLLAPALPPTDCFPAQETTQRRHARIQDLSHRLRKRIRETPQEK